MKIKFYVAFSSNILETEELFLRLLCILLLEHHINVQERQLIKKYQCSVHYYVMLDKVLYIIIGLIIVFLLRKAKLLKIDVGPPTRIYN